MQMLAVFYVYGMVFLFGSAIGSFLNVVIYRLPRGNFFGEKRSYCPSCSTQLKAYDLIPILSYLILGGRCRFCRARISPRYPFVELSGGVIALACLLRFDVTAKAIWVFGILSVFLAITMIDFDTMEIPDSLHIALIPFAMGAIWLVPSVPLWSRVAGILIISVPILLITVWKEGAFGGGDIKLCAVCGFLLGVPQMGLSFFFALVFGGGYAIFLLARKRKSKQDHIAFGPYICLGVTMALFFGENILSWYLSFFR